MKYIFLEYIYIYSTFYSNFRIYIRFYSNIYILHSIQIFLKDSKENTYLISLIKFNKWYITFCLFNNLSINVSKFSNWFLFYFWLFIFSFYFYFSFLILIFIFFFINIDTINVIILHIRNRNIYKRNKKKFHIKSIDKKPKYIIPTTYIECENN